MNTSSLLVAYGLVLIALAISWAHRLGLEKDVLWSSLRATVQLLVMGYLLQWIFSIREAWGYFVILTLMAGIAALISGNRGRAVPRSHPIAFAGIALGSVVTFAVLYAAGVIRPEVNYIIPIGGMIIGNAMNASSLCFNRLIGEMSHQRRRIETLLALGADARQAARAAVRQTVRSAMIPTIDSMKTIGLVHLPGIMTGFLIAGGSPLEAVKFQLAVVYMIAGAAGIAVALVSLLASRQCFTRDLQLLPHLRPGLEGA